MPFQFLDPGELRDQELELIAPAQQWIDDYVAGFDAPSASSTRTQLEDFLRIAPSGRHDGDPASGRVPCYHFWLRLHPIQATPRSVLAAAFRSPSAIAGSIALRVAGNEDIERNLGHIGYNVHPFARGNHYAERACRLLRPLAMRHALSPVWITCNPDNYPSRRTCQRLGASLIEIVTLPLDHPLRQRGDHDKCRYRWDL